MNFVYNLADWEVLAYDGRVLEDAQLRHNFKTPERKYLLGDAGFSNSKYVLAPHRGVRYHSRDQRLVDKRPQAPEERHNLRHASLRNIIVRIFGVFKGKFRILIKPLRNSNETQTHLIMGLVALYNIFRSRETIEEDERDATAKYGAEKVESKAVNHGSKQMESLPKEITIDMWEQYTKHRDLS